MTALHKTKGTTMFLMTAICHAPSVRRPRVKFPNPLNEMKVNTISIPGVKRVLNSSFDAAAYQLVLDGMLPPMPIQWRELPQHEQSLLRDKMSNLCAAPAAPRTEVQACHLVIGCDEAGRGPLAGPVVAAAFSRVPLSLIQSPRAARNSIMGGSEKLAVYDSKKLTRPMRDKSFARLSGHKDFVALAESVAPVIHEIGVNNRPHPSNLMPLLTLKKSLVCSWSGHVADREADYLRIWSIAMANHRYIDEHDILDASLLCMTVASQQVWNTLRRPARALYQSDVVPRDQCDQMTIPECLSIAQKKLQEVRDGDFLAASANEIFLGETGCPPLVLVDGSMIPSGAATTFTAPTVGGAVHSVVKGDTRSYSIAAASILAKCARDASMELLDKKFPVYGFAEHAGYPTSKHRAAIRKHGLSSVHRKSFRSD